MGSWRSTMPLLSTLAALVIIVHSAEEELERGYRRDLRPRAVDTTSHEQPWKAIDMEPLVPQSTRGETWIEPPGEVPPRRRPVRKRKRRPLPYPDTEPHERHQESIQAAYHDVDYHDSQHAVEAPKKRRKRPDNMNLYFTDEPTTVSERPLRRRGLRKKRPDYDEQLAEIIAPADFDGDEEFNNDKQKEYLDKYNHFDDDYDNTERNNMHETRVDFKFETDDMEDRLHANYLNNKHMLGYNRSHPYGILEQKEQFVGVSESVSLVSSSEEYQDVPEKLINLSSTEPPRKEIVANATNSTSDADIMVMMHKPKVEKVKLGIIINGTEQSYLHLQVPEEPYNDYAELMIATHVPKTTTEMVTVKDLTTVIPYGENNIIHLNYIAKEPKSAILPYAVSKDYTENNEDLNYDEKPTPNVVPTYNFSNTETSSTEKSNSAINLGKNANELNYILFPISPKKFIAIYYGLKDSAKTNNIKIYSGSKSTTENAVLPISKVEVSTTDIPEDVHTSTAEITDNDIEKEVANKSNNVFDYAMFEEVVNIPKEKILTHYDVPGEIVGISNGVSATNLPRNKSGVTKYRKTPTKKILHYPKKWINTNKWITKVNVLIPVLTPEEFYEFDFMPEEFEEKGAIDPLMLKQLLKRSNGSSLSEMLQRHNLSLTDLLQGRDEAISALNADPSGEPQPQLHDDSLESNPQLNGAESKYPTRRQTSSREKYVPTETSSDEETKGRSDGNIETAEPVTEKVVTDTEKKEIRARMNTKRRFPTGIRRKLRMRPMLNSTLKAQLSRDLIALSARKYSHNNRNVTKSREWKDVVPLMLDRSKSDDENSKDDDTEITTTTTDAPIETTISTLEISNTSYSSPGEDRTSDVKDNEVENAVTTTEATTTIIIEVLPDEMNSEIEKPKVIPIMRPSTNNSTFRRQAFNNRLKRKRLKHRSSTTENPTDDLMKNFLGMANLVSASQFIERTQKPYTTIQENTEFATDLEDFMTTQSPPIMNSEAKSTLIATTRFSTTSTPKNLSPESITTSTEQSAKFEIEEILNDTMTSERLAKILRERNMTLSELVNHRERGSSHVHLADIFHNASKEPNPPEPFLTKSSIEPISKETYPLRAILEANTHETTTRSSTQGDQKNYINIPVVMDFGNNVNENGESMGIMSLFNKLTDSDAAVDKAEIRKDSDGTPYVSSVISVNATNANDTNRESRVLTDGEDWSELLSFMKAHNISTFMEDLQSLNKGDAGKESLEDLDEDGLMVLEDMQHLQNFDNNITPGSNENVDMNTFERRENLSEKPGILSKLPSNTKSVAIATASILGLAAILFLLTYIAFKWKQQRNKLRKKESFCDGPIPTPVFENRKSHKNNCSSRSISPMISNTNIYMSTLDSNGKESPDYTWNSLRKPFQ